MRNRRTWQLFIISVIFFAVITIYLPRYSGATELLSLALSVTSVLFGLLIGFFITQMWNKFSSIRRESAILRSSLLGMISNMRRLEGNEEVKEKFFDRMERFLIAFIMISWDSVEEEDRYFDRVTETISEVEILNERDKVIFTQLLDAESSASEARSELTTLGKESLMRLEWAVLMSLSSIIIVSVLLLRDGSTFFRAVATVLPSLMVLTMLILDDLDNLRWGSDVISFEPAEAALKELNKEKFYEKRFVKEEWVKEPENYRTEEDLDRELRDVYEELKIKDCLRKNGLLGPKL